MPTSEHSQMLKDDSELPVGKDVTAVTYQTRWWPPCRMLANQIMADLVVLCHSHPKVSERSMNVFFRSFITRALEPSLAPAAVLPHNTTQHNTTQHFLFRSQSRQLDEREAKKQKRDNNNNNNNNEHKSIVHRPTSQQRIWIDR